METKEIVEVNIIEQSLVKENVTATVIQGLRDKYSKLTIAGIDDKDGYAIVKKARLECRDLRILAEKITKKGREQAVAVQKAWLKKEKEVVGEISEVEEYLQAQEAMIDNAKQKIIDDRNEERVDQLLGFGWNGNAFEISKMTDEAFTELLDKTIIDWNTEQEHLEKEAQAKKEEEDRLEQQRLDQEAQQKKLDDQEAEIKAKEIEQRKEQERIDGEKKAIEDARLKKIEDDKKEAEIKEAQDKARLQAIEDEKERVRIETLENEKKDREAKADEEKRLALLPDKEKLLMYAQTLEGVEKPVVASEEMRKIFSLSIVMLEDLVRFLRKE